MSLYHTGLWHMDFDDEAFLTRAARGWKFKLSDHQVPPRFDLDRALRFKNRRGFVPPFVDNLQAEPRQAPEILIEAPNRLTAQRALNLVRACNAIVNGDLLGDLEAVLAIPHDPGRPEGLNKYELDAGFWLNIAAHHLGIAARMAIRASHARSFQYAIHKLFLSLQTASAPVMDFHPRYNPQLYKVESDPANHVKLSNAITLAHSAIEEMQLEVRGSHKKPAVKPDGGWDPERLADLRKRLTAAGVDTAEPIIWSIRGTPTRIQRMKRHPKGTPAVWASGAVRDQEVPLTDALRFASSLRSSVTTHKFVSESQSISLYDAHNVQHLARRLIMERLGCWRV